ncbi:MAG: PadR family transcriptional regulator [Chloroflexota bacterium]
MSLKHVILGFIEMTPLSGYDLKTMFDSSVQFYWSATHPQIYRTLDEMLKEGWLSVTVVQQTERPNKKVYSVTEKGSVELRRWLETPFDLPSFHHPLLVRLAWSDRLENAQIEAILESYIGKLQERLALYASDNQQQVDQFARTERENFLWQMILDNGVHFYQSELAWVEKVLAGLAQFPKMER